MTINDQCRELRLYYLAENLEQFLANANKAKWPLKESLGRMVELEKIEKHNRSIQQRLRSAKIGRTKLMNQFDWAWPGEIDRTVIDELMRAEFIDNHQNIILAGPQGVGKTMIAKNIGLSAITRGHKVLFTTASELVIDLGAQESSAALQRRIKKYISPELLIIDELG